MFDIVAIIATLAAVGGLIFTGVSFIRLGKTEEVRGFEGVYRDIARGLKEYRLLEAESPRSDKKQEEERQRKLEVLNSEFLADVSWLCYLIRHGQIKDETLVRSLKDQIIDWYYGFAERRPMDVNISGVFADFQILALRFIYDKELGVKRHCYTNFKYTILRKNYYY